MCDRVPVFWYMKAHFPVELEPLLADPMPHGDMSTHVK